MKLLSVASCNGVENLVCQFALLVGESEATQAISWGRTCSASHSHAWWALAAWADMTTFFFAAAVRMVMSVISFCVFFWEFAVFKVEPNDIMGDILLESEH